MRRETMRRMLRALAAACAAAVLLAGCASIPRSGPVAEGGKAASQDDGFGQIDYHPSSPVAGETQAEVLSGFIAAAVSPDNGYQIAREYLASSFASQWNPDASVTVDRGTGRDDPTRVNSTQLTLDVEPVAFVDQAGNYLTADSHAPIPLQYSFTKEDGQWRISKAPDGIVIDSNRFQTVFSPQTLYFYSADFRYLVPDERWFPATRASLSTRVVKALLAGPSEWLKEAVATAFPSGTQLVSGSVPVQDGTAMVDLNSAAGSADSATLDRMDEQLTESLSGAGSVTDVQLSIAGVDRPSGAPSATGAVHDPAVNVNPLVLQGGKFGFLTSGKVSTSLEAVGGKIASLKPSAVSVTADGSAAAVKAKQGVYAINAQAASPVLVDDRTGLIAPSVDNRGAVWSATASPDAAIHVAYPDGTTVDLDPAWSNARTLISFGISRDGTRLAALVRTTDGQSHVMVAGIARNSDGRPTGIGEPVDLGNVGLSEGLSLAWTDELTVVVLGNAPGGGTAIVSQSIGGTRSTTSGPSGGVTVAGGNPASQYWVLTSGGDLETPAGNGWQSAADKVTVLAVQQGRG
ncbi:LpqB family beta-propeller domain-containing protein [Gryllotalpicola ginsengisoli]|uniref:LpqB family beta-propeller domain-containing protein n=1 Tax=Gryllotalpicola ginsengisoli TaxID=444608 RepID=UPI00041334C9|nr:LpqB family beta-propeller domain-containing protein [Gryllotalpicola ginsengisoli]